MSECLWNDEWSLPFGNVPQKRLHLVERHTGHNLLHLLSLNMNLNEYPMILKGSSQNHQTSVSDRAEYVKQKRLESGARRTSQHSY